MQSMDRLKALRRVDAQKTRQKKPAGAVQSFVRFELESESAVAAAPGADFSYLFSAGAERAAALRYGVALSARRSQQHWYLERRLQ